MRLKRSSGPRRTQVNAVHQWAWTGNLQSKWRSPNPLASTVHEIALINVSCGYYELSIGIFAEILPCSPLSANQLWIIRWDVSVPACFNAPAIYLLLFLHLTGVPITARQEDLFVSLHVFSIVFPMMGCWIERSGFLVLANLPVHRRFAPSVLTGHFSNAPTGINMSSYSCFIDVCEFIDGTEMYQMNRDTVRIWS